MIRTRGTRESTFAVSAVVMGLIILAAAFIHLSGTIGEIPPAVSASQGGQPAIMQSGLELFEESRKEKKGLTFYIRGQTVPGVVTRFIGTEAVEVRNQTHSRIIILLDRIDAVAMN